MREPVLQVGVRLAEVVAPKAGDRAGLLVLRIHDAHRSAARLADSGNRQRPRPCRVRQADEAAADVGGVVAAERAMDHRKRGTPRHSAGVVEDAPAAQTVVFAYGRVAGKHAIAHRERGVVVVDAAANAGDLAVGNGQAGDGDGCA